MIKKAIAQFLIWTPPERNGIIVLLLLFIGISVFRYWPRPAIDVQWESVSFGIDSTSDKSIAKFPVQNRKVTKVIALSPFDPNYLSAKQMREYAFSNQLITAIFKYKSEVGYIKDKIAFESIVQAFPSEWERLQPYVKFKESAFAKKTTTNSEQRLRTTKFNKPIDINTANAEELKTLRGIGPVLARRTLKYRKLLGGFVNIDQLSEVYGIDSNTISINRERLHLSRENLNRIKLNQVEFDSLKLHPYINYKLAERLCNFRNLHGPFNKLEDLLEVYGWDEPQSEKMKEYLTFD